MDFGGAANRAERENVDWLEQAPHQERERGVRPDVPSRDPFYSPPAGYARARPGTVLRSRDVQLGFLGRIPQAVRATQLLYRSTDHLGLPAGAVTTVLLPDRYEPRGRTPILSYQVAIDALTTRCFPSYALRRGARAIGAMAQVEYPLACAALAEGWVVSIPDHEGLHGNWGAPREPGYFILDGLRAALNHRPLGLSPRAPIGLWGYSGGGLATAWAAQMHADYAAELNVAGAVLGSPVGDLGDAFRKLNGTLYAGLPAMVVAALSRIYPDLDAVIDAHASPRGKAMLADMARSTTALAVARMAGKKFDGYVDIPLEALLATPAVRDVFERTKLGATAPDIPVLIVQAAHDRIISVGAIDSLADAYSAGGTDVTYHRDLFSEHMLLHSLSAPMTLRWLRDRFAGRSPSHRRARTTWPTLFNPRTYLGMLWLGLVAVRVATGRRVRRRPLSRRLR